MEENAKFFNVNNKSITIKENPQTHQLKRLFIVSLFGSIIFVGNMFLPFPINFMFIALEAVLLALSSLFIKNVGATYVGSIGGLLTALGSPGLGIFTFIALALYGVLVDLTLFIFKIKGSPQGVNRNRLIAAIAISTMLIGIITYSASVIIPEYVLTPAGIPTFIMQRSWTLDIMVMFMGPATGATAGYATAYLWNKYLKSITLTL
jgi:hypothetical protein